MNQAPGAKRKVWSRVLLSSRPIRLWFFKLIIDHYKVPFEQSTRPRPLALNLPICSGSIYHVSMWPQNVQNTNHLPSECCDACKNHKMSNSLEFDWLTDFCTKFGKSQIGSNSSSAVKMVVRTRSHGNHSTSPAATPVAGGGKKRHVHPRQSSKMSANESSPILSVTISNPSVS